MKQWSLALCLALALVLTACAGGNSSQNSSAQSPSDASDTSQSDSGAQEAAGLLSSFSTTDLEGNAVDQSILEDYDLTMVNVWATYCTPCLQEMPDLGELASEYEDKGVQILGLVSDVLNSDGTISDSQVETAQEIVEETGASYQHLLPSADLLGLLSQIYGVPTTFFVDSAGNQVGYAYVTAMEREQFVEIIDAALAEVAA